MVGGYSLLGALGCGYLLYVSTLPVLIPDDWPAQGPGLPGGIVFLAALLAGLPWAVLPVPLLIGGLAHLRRAAPGGWRWLVAWVGAVGAGVTLEALVITGFGYHFPSPTYTGSGLVSWVSLGESLGFVTLGVALTAILSGVRAGPSTS